MRELHLTNREQQVMNLLLQGYSNIEIAKELGMSYRTVKSHLNRMFMRFGITSGIKRVKLAVMFFRKQKECEALRNEVLNAVREG